MTDAPTPWSTDRILDDHIARSHLAAAADDLPLDDLRWAGRGWDADVYRAGSLGFRFPRRFDYADAHRWESELLARVAPVLAPLGIQVPVHLRTLGPTDAFPYPVAAFRWVEGSELTRVRTEATLSALRMLGTALRHIHALPSDDLAAAGVPRSVWSLEDRVREAQGDLAALEAGVPAAHPVLRPAMAWLRAVDAAQLPDLGTPSARLLHGDVGAEHVLVDARGHLTGLIDWGDAMVEDPANDFVGIAAEWGADGLAAALAGYGPEGRDLTPRIVWMARATSLHWVRDRLATGNDLHDEVRRVRNAFQLPLG